MDFTNLVNNFTNQVGTYLPGVLGALVVLLIGWFIAKGLQSLTRKLLGRTNLNERMGKSAFNSDAFLSKLVYYVVMIMVLLIVLEMLGVSQVLDPLRNMVNEFMAFVPNLIAGVLIGIVGYVIATIASELTGAAGTALQSGANRLGIAGNIDLVKILRNLVFIVIFIPVLIAALDALKIEAISEPASEMLGTIFDAIPNILAAAIIIGLFYVGARYLTTILKDVLKGMGTDEWASRMKLSGIIGERRSMSNLLANLAFFFIMFIGIITGVERLQFAQLTDMLNNLLELSGQVFFGLAIMAVGNFLANMAANAVSGSENGKLLSSVARFAILGVFLAIALRTMGIANEIVNLAFGLTLGAVAVAFALSFGLGGREAAGRHMEHLLSRFRKDK